MKLYWYWSFNPQKIRLALAELGVDADIVNVDLFKGEQRAEDYRAIHPRGRVPALEDDGAIIWESNAILVYLAEKTGRLWPDSVAARANATRWLFFEARHLSDSVGRLWFNDFVLSRMGRAGDQASRDVAAENLPAELTVVERHLAGNSFMLVDGFSLVDCCYGPVLDALSLSNFSLTPYPGIEAYLARMRERPAWARCQFVTPD